jgi:hypothetical protein
MSELSKLIMESVSLIGDLRNFDRLAIEMTSSALQPVAGKYLLTAAQRRTRVRLTFSTNTSSIDSTSLSSRSTHKLAGGLRGDLNVALGKTNSRLELVL